MIYLTVILFLTQIGPPVLGIIIPAAILVVSFLLTWILYRKFSRKD